MADDDPPPQIPDPINPDDTTLPLPADRGGHGTGGGGDGGGVNSEDLDTRIHMARAGAGQSGAAPTTPAGPGAWDPPLPEDLAPHLPAYEVTGVLGRGGMGAVYRGRHRALEREVAIKILPPEVGADPAFAERFRREAVAMAALDHPNIVTIYDFGELEGLKTPGGDSSFYFVMEFVEGADLHRLLRTGELDQAQALDIVCQVCAALGYAHEKGYVHRDIKPANIFLTPGGRVKVGDFGLAKLIASESGTLGGESPEPSLTMTGYAMGTASYVAPETMRAGATVDHRADIYALGVMLYELLTGEVPRGLFKLPSERPDCDADPAIDPVVAKALEQEPDDRYADTAELSQALEVIGKKEAEHSGTVPEPSDSSCQHSDFQASPTPWRKNLGFKSDF